MAYKLWYTATVATCIATYTYNVSYIKCKPTIKDLWSFGFHIIKFGKTVTHLMPESDTINTITS